MVLYSRLTKQKRTNYFLISVLPIKGAIVGVKLIASFCNGRPVLPVTAHLNVLINLFLRHCGPPKQLVQ